MILKFDFASKMPLYLQLRNQIVIGIAEGKLSPGEKLPTVRSLADESGINSMTVSKAYQLLKQENYIVTDRRGGTAVASHTPEKVDARTVHALRLHISELRISGMSKEDVLDLCAKLYEEGDQK
jgi:DNA-binding transcriptional regulator YhcF (GntR family)